MSMAFSDRSRTWTSALRFFLPALAVFAASTLLHHPAVVIVLLAANALMMVAVCQASGFGPSSYLKSLRERGSAYLLLLVAYAAFATILIAYPLQLLMQEASLGAALAMSTVVVVALLAPWRLWPAFVLVFMTRARRANASGIIGRSLGESMRIAADNELFFSHGLAVALCLLALVFGAVSIAGIFPIVSEAAQAIALACYALVIAPLAHVIMVNRTATARLIDLRRQRADRMLLSLAAPDADTEPQAVPVVAPEAPRGPEDFDTMLLRCARAGQIDLALAALAHGADPKSTPPASDRDQRTVLALATLSSDMRLLRGLIAKGADLNGAHAGLYPLIAATRDSHEGRPDAVTMLLTNGADPRCVDAEGNTPLHYASLSALPIVAALLCDAAAPIDVVNREGLTPLAMACGAGNWELVRFLLDRGAKPEYERSQPALLCAASAPDDDPRGVAMLLKRKVNVDARDALGRTALMMAALQGHRAVSAALLAAGAKADLADSRGTTALMEATRSGVEEVVKLIAAADPARDAVDASGRTALIIACQSRHACEATVRQLLGAGVSRDLAAPDGRRAIEFAAQAGRWNIVALLDPDFPLPANIAEVAVARDDDVDFAVHLLDALRFEHWQVADDCAEDFRDWTAPQRLALFRELAEHASPAPRHWLLAHGLQRDIQTAEADHTYAQLLERLPATTAAALEWHSAGAFPPRDAIALVAAALGTAAADRPRLERMAQEMVMRGADIFAVSADGRSPLALATAAGSIALTRELLERGVDPNLRDGKGRTALYAALALPADAATNMVRLLISAGADPELVAANGETPLGLALARPEPDLRAWLNWPLWKPLRRPVRGQDLPAAAALGDLEAVQKLLDLGVPIDACDGQGATALLRAAGCGHASLVARLLELGADPLQAALSGATALSAAVSARNEKVVAALLQHGVPVDQRLPSGGTALMIAAALGFPEIAAQLLAHGASPGAEDERGTRALHAAAQFAFRSTDTARCARLIESLIERGADVNASNAGGQTPLLLLLGACADAGSAADQKHLLALLPLLLCARADVNFQDQRGVSPLHACAMHGLLLPARSLLAARADPSRRDVLDRSAREIAHLLGYIDVAAELGASESAPLVRGLVD